MCATVYVWRSEDMGFILLSDRHLEMASLLQVSTDVIVVRFQILAVNRQACTAGGLRHKVSRRHSAA